jgi:hypothetical protein
MSYRISNTEKWKDLWFSDLSIKGKLLFFYFVENCDNAGFFEVNKKLMLFHLGFNEEELMSAGNELRKSYIKSKDGTKLWIKNFLKYQKKLPLNPANGSHKQIIHIIQENLSNENKFKGNDILNSLLPNEFQYIKPQRKKREIVENTSDSNSDTPKYKLFVKPTQEEILEYMNEKKFEFSKTESVLFFNFYESKGWKVGKNSMTYWKSAVATWMIHYYKRNKINTPKIAKLEEIEKVYAQNEKIDYNEQYKQNLNEQFN